MSINVYPMRDDLLKALTEGQAIYWNSSTYSPKEGYGYAYYKYTQALNKLGIHCITQSDFAPELIDLSHIVKYEMLYDEGLEPPLINHCLPEMYLHTNSYNIGMTYWETDAVPNHWIDFMYRMDEIWTSSKYVKDVYLKQNVNEKIFDFNQGIDPEIYKVNFNEPEREQFTFLSFGSPSSRKNAQYTYDAFMELFGGDERYHLIIKSSGPSDVRNIQEGVNLGAVKNSSQVTVIEEMLSEEEVAQLLRSVHCLVYPTSGEGWGLVPYSAIASGTPTICTNATACEEYAELSIPIDYTWKEPWQAAGVYSHGGKWAMPDLNQLREKMQSVTENYDAYKSMTIRSAQTLQNTHTWDRVALKMGKHLVDSGIISQIKVGK